MTPGLCSSVDSHEIDKSGQGRLAGAGCHAVLRIVQCLLGNCKVSVTHQRSPVSLRKEYAWCP